MKQPITVAVKRIGAIGTPLLCARVLQYSHQVADSAMLGHFGQGSDDLAAIGIASLFAWILKTVLWPLYNSVQAITARRFGEQTLVEADVSAGAETGSLDGASAGAEQAGSAGGTSTSTQNAQLRTGEALDNGIATALYIGLCALALSFLARPVLSLLLQSDAILERALAYIAIMRIALLPIGAFFVMQGFLAAINETRYVMWSGLLSNALNIALNYVLIFGRLGFEPLGIRGAAIGTAIAWISSSLFLLVIIRTKGYDRDYGLFRFRRLRFRLQRDIIALSLPPCVQNVTALSIFMVYQTIIEDYSTVLLAATHSAFAFFRLNKTLIGGYARGAGILVGNALGRGDKAKAQSLTKAGGIIAAGVAVLIVLATVLAREGIASLFTGDAATQEAVSAALVFFVGFFFVEALGYAFESVFVAAGYVRFVLASEVFTNVVFILGATVLARVLFPGDVRLAWLGFGLYQIAHACIMLYAYKRGKWLEAGVESAAAEENDGAGNAKGTGRG